MKKKRGRGKRIIIILLAVFVLLIILTAAGLYSIGSEEIEYSEALDLTAVDTIVTAEEYEKLEMGMSLEEVESIIGGKGKLMYDSDDRIEYAWPGEYYSKGSEHFRLDAGFNKHDNTLSLIEEDCILFGKTAKEYEEIQMSEDYSGIDTVTIKKKQLKHLEDGMSYMEVSSAMGGEGVKVFEKRRYKQKAVRNFVNMKQRIMLHMSGRA